MFETEIIKHADAFPHQEVCGVVVLEPNLSVRVIREKNEHPTPKKQFCISPARFLGYKLNYNLLGIYHSHPTANERPSVYDKAMAEEMGLPYLIYSLKTQRFNLYFPQSYEPPSLTGRPYVKGFFECSCILKDYFFKYLNLNISPWNKNYWLPHTDKKANSLLLKILNKNLKHLKDNEIKKHDVLVFEIRKGRRLHIGIYEGDDTFVHQPLGTLSRSEVLDSRWQRKIKGVYREPSLV